MGVNKTHKSEKEITDYIIKIEVNRELPQTNKNLKRGFTSLKEDSY